jgi:hypothetical protein
MKTNKLKKYIKELDNLMASSNEDIRMIASITSRLDQISKKSELVNFIETLKCRRDFAYTASDIKFMSKVIDRLEKLL